MSNPNVATHTWELICYDDTGRVIQRRTVYDKTLDEVETMLTELRKDEQVASTSYKLLN